MPTKLASRVSYILGDAVNTPISHVKILERIVQFYLQSDIMMKFKFVTWLQLCVVHALMTRLILNS